MHFSDVTFHQNELPVYSNEGRNPQNIHLGDPNSRMSSVGMMHAAQGSLAAWQGVWSLVSQENEKSRILRPIGDSTSSPNSTTSLVIILMYRVGFPFGLPLGIMLWLAAQSPGRHHCCHRDSGSWRRFLTVVLIQKSPILKAGGRNGFVRGSSEKVLKTGTK